MKKPNKRFALRIYSRYPVQISMIYLGQDSAGEGIVQEVSLVGCRVLGNYPVVAGETLNVRIALPNSPRPLIIEQATVQWVKGLEFGIAFGRLAKREADQLQRLLDALLEAGSYSGRPAGSLSVKPPAA
ncbi:MAG: PilZ domain-containing protein [Nitrospirae bacterium]|nr:PilZ domain-containing protein [Nitrospirota bacterium]